VKLDLKSRVKGEVNYVGPEMSPYGLFLKSSREISMSAFEYVLGH